VTTSDHLIAQIKQAEAEAEQIIATAKTAAQAETDAARTANQQVVDDAVAVAKTAGEKELQAAKEQVTVTFKGESDKIDKELQTIIDTASKQQSKATALFVKQFSALFA